MLNPYKVYLLLIVLFSLSRSQIPTYCIYNSTPNCWCNNPYEIDVTTYTYLNASYSTCNEPVRTKETQLSYRNYSCGSGQCKSCIESRKNCIGLPWYNSSKDTFRSCNCSNDYFKTDYLLAPRLLNYTVTQQLACPLGATTYTSLGKRNSEVYIVDIALSIPSVIITWVEAPPWVAIQFNAYSSWTRCPDNTGPCYIDIPYQLFASSGEVIVKIYWNDILQKTQTFYVPPSDICKDECIVCIRVLDTWNCHSDFIKASIIITFIAACLFLITFVYFLIKHSYNCYRFFNPVIPQIQITTSDTQPVQANSDKSSSFWSMFKRNPKPTVESEVVTLYCVVLLALLFTPSFGCTTATIVATPTQNCLQNGPTETCTFQLNSVLILPYLNSEACISFTSSKTSAMLGELKIKYVGMKKIVNLQHLYYTSDWLGLGKSDRSCYNSNGCHGNDCASYTGIPIDRNMVGATTNLYPGRSICTSQCGCAGCGCFYCDSSCVYSRFALMPTGFISQVLAPFSTMLEPTISWTYTPSNSTPLTGTASLASGYIDINPSIKLAILGSLAGSSEEFGSRKVIISGSVVKIGFASDSNSPQSGSIGDIQSPTIAGLTNPNPNSFIFDNSVAVASFTTDATNYFFTTPGIRVLSGGQYASLPGIFGTALYSLSNGQLIGNDIAPGALLLTMTSSVPLELTTHVDIVCPKISSGFVSGCYLCQEGFKVILTARSTCSAGSALVEFVTSNNVTVLNNYVDLLQSDSEITISVFSTEKYIYGDLKLSFGSYSDIFHIQGVLNDPAGIVITNGTLIPSWATTSPSTNGFSEWFNSLPGLWNVFKWVIIAGIIVAVVLVIGILAYYLYTHFYETTEPSYSSL